MKYYVFMQREIGADVKSAGTSIRDATRIYKECLEKAKRNPAIKAVWLEDENGKHIFGDNPKPRK